MGGVIDVPGKEPWFIAGYEFAMLLDRAQEELADPGDRLVLEKAEALSGLFFEYHEAPQASRLARALQRSASALAEELAENPRDARDRGAALAFENLERLLDHVPP